MKEAADPPSGHPSTSGANVFDELADRYDGWFETPRGRAIFRIEVACLKELMSGEYRGRWLEVGVGTGRFAEALGIKEGVDPSRAVLEFAAKRGIKTKVGYGESLPYLDAAFDGVLLVTTICFLDDPKKTLKECRRVLKRGGRLVVGLVPADSAWGTFYTRKGREGHPFYSQARFYTCDQVIDLARRAGLVLDGARSCLLTSPEEPVADAPSLEGMVTGAGFVAMKFRREID